MNVIRDQKESIKKTQEKKAMLSKTEYGIYAECVNNPNSVAYNLPVFLKLDKNTDIEKLKNAVETAMNAHPYLKTRISVNEEGFACKNVCEEPVQVDIKEMLEKDFDKKSFIYPFDLLNERLYRISIIKLTTSVVFFLDVHHIIFDGTSLPILLRDIDKAYNGQALSTEMFTGYDVSREETERLQTVELEEAKEYYKSVFGGIELDSLPIYDKKEDKLSAATIDYTFQSFSPDDIRAYSNRNGIKTSTFFYGVFGYVLAQFSGEEASLFSTIFHGRNEKLANACGMFVKTLPVYCTIAEDIDIVQYLKAIDLQMDNNRKYDLYSYADLCTDLQIKPQVLFAYQGDMLMHMSFCGSETAIDRAVVSDPIETITANFSRKDGSFSMNLEYREDLYDKESMEIFLYSFEKAVTEFLNKKSLSEIEIVDNSQISLLDSFNQTEKDYEKTDVITLFRRQVQVHPDNTAVVYLDKSYTYKEVDEISERIGVYIASLGIGTEDVVSVLITRCEYMAIASLGILKAGAAYQPLDPSYPEERLAFMIKDADAKLLIADKELLDHVPEYKGKVLLTQDIPSLPDCEKISKNPKTEDLFIMLYTSGSTGVPKGCMLEHRNIVSFCNWYRNYYQLSPKSKVAAYASYGFDANMMDMYPALTTGASVYIIDESIRLDLVKVNKYFNENGITHSFMTTQVSRMFALECDCKTLQHLSAGGEKLVPFYSEKNFTFHNGYGPTECTIFTTVFPLDQEYARVPIGKPLDNTKLYVVDKQGKRVPPCVPGELWIAGHGVSRGYLNRPEQNEKAFAKNPFTDESGYERIYKTGDIVRFLPDGNIDFIGRNDGQVKIRGFRIELSEVESIIRDFPGIKDATVADFDEPSGGKFIAAYVVSDETIDIEKLNDFILANKPPYMVPAVTMQIDRIPLNQNQKVNKRALPVPEREAEDIQPPENEMQQRIFDCISEVTGTKNFGIATDIFCAGVTSIGAIRLNVLLSKEFDTIVRIGDLKEHNTVLKLEKFLSNTEKAEQYQILPDYPITQTQNGIFIECTANPNTTIYNIPYLFRLGDKVDTDRLKAAVEKTIDAHPYVKTKLFLNENGDIRAARNDSEKPKVEVIECEELPEKETLVMPFVLLNGDLYRAKIYHTKTANYLFLDFHHIICDGTSEAVLLEDMNRFYEGSDVESENYTGFEAALDEEKSRKTEAYTKAKEYYDSVFQGCDTDFLPVKDKSEAEPSVGECQFTSDLSAEEIKKFCTEHNITLNAFFNGVFAFVLSRYNDKDEVLYTTVYNGRNDSRLSRAVTMLVKTFPVYGKTEGERKVADLLLDMKNQLMQSMANDIYSFAEIAGAYNIKADILFVYQGDNFVFDTVAGEKAEGISLSRNAAKAPITINVFLQKNKLVFSFEYRSDMYEESTMLGMAECMSVVSGEFLEKTYLKEVSMLSESAGKLLDSFNQTETEYERTDIITLFRRQAESHPDNTAVVYLDRSYTYKEVDEISERIGAYIASLGIGTEDVVSVLIPRCEYMMIASLGVLKAGAAYQPLDPSYPEERLMFMIKDADAKLLIADKELLDHVPEYKGKVLLTQDIPSLPDCEKISKNPKPEDLFIMLYTSGSTGMPKGCMLEHRNIVAFCNWYRNYYHLTPQSKVAAYASYGFDANMMDMYPALTSGSGLYIIDESIRLDLVKVNQYLNENEITHSFMTTQVGRMFALECDCKTLQYLSVGGEKLVPLTPPEKLKMRNLYGPTECTVCVTAFEVDKIYSRVPIGKPLNNTKLYVVDKQGRRVPPCVPGELWAAGHGVSRGYLKRPEQTQKAFAKNPFTDEDGYERVYKTGDIVRFLPDGNIDFIGRNDGQVKIRGFRIELSEVESIIRDFPGIKDATVVAFDEPGGGKYIAAYVVSDEKVDIAALNEFISANKPPYMVPAVTMQIDSIPLNQNQKVNKRALPMPERKREYKMPETDLQKKLCNLFASALGTDKIGIDENFFEIGGTSLSAAKIAMHAMTEKLPIAYRDIFDNPTVCMLEQHILKQQKSIDGKEENETKIELEGIEKVLQYNTNAYVDEVTYTDTGDILLTGATGYLGIHVLAEIMKHTKSAVYCLVRKGKAKNVETRLKGMLVYYFSDGMENLFGTRIIPVEGDITDTDIIDSLEKYPFKTIINCAASVKHFVNDDSLDRINVQGVENLIAFCTKTGRRLVQVSTVSVAGTNINRKFPPEKKIHENELYFGQDLSNKYADTKFRAEKAILEAVANDNLDGKIIRVGNLMSRYSDGEFQINSITNGFMKTIRSYAVIGKFPVSRLDEIVEFSPIDFTAAAVMYLAGTNSKFTVFQAYNAHKLEMGDVVEALNRCGIKIEIVTDRAFSEAFQEALKDEKKNMLISGLISYMSSDSENSEEFIGGDNTFTIKALYRLGFKWPIINETYLENAFKALETLGYFDGRFDE